MSRGEPRPGELSRLDEQRLGVPLVAEIRVGRVELAELETEQQHKLTRLLLARVLEPFREVLGGVPEVTRVERLATRLELALCVRHRGARDETDRH